jgi:hypothetical protein
MRRRTRNQRGFWLLEAILAVTIFSLGILTLGSAINNCLIAQRIKEEDVRARLVLGNRMAEIEAGVVEPKDTRVEDLKGGFEGMKLKQTRRPVKRKNEKDQDITGIWEITLEAQWKSDNRDQSRQISFYFNPVRGNGQPF